MSDQIKIKYQKLRSDKKVIFCGGCRSGCPGWNAFKIPAEFADLIMQLSGLQQGGASQGEIEKYDNRCKQWLADAAASLGYGVKVKRKLPCP